jgi:hypothetical protein
MSFLGNIKKNINSGGRSAKAAYLFQQVINRPLNVRELNLIKEYDIQMDFSEDINEHDFVVDYISFLVGSDDHPSQLPRLNLSHQAKLEIVNFAVKAAKSGLLALRGDTNESLAEYLATHYR